MCCARDTCTHNHLTLTQAEFVLSGKCPTVMRQTINEKHKNSLCIERGTVDFLWPHDKTEPKPMAQVAAARLLLIAGGVVICNATVIVIIILS